MGESISASDLLTENLDWEKVEARAQTDPLFRRMVDSVRFGGMTRERALIQGALALADSNAMLTENFKKMLNTTVRSVVSVPRDNAEMNVDEVAKGLWGRQDVRDAVQHLRNGTCSETWALGVFYCAVFEVAQRRCLPRKRKD